MNQTSTIALSEAVVTTDPSPPETTTPDDSWLFGSSYEEESSGDYGDYYYDFLGGSSKDVVEETNEVDSKPLPILFNEGIDLHSLNITKLDFQPQVWNAQAAFTDKVLGRLYLIVPGAIGGLLMGVILWALFTIVLRSLSAVKKKVISEISEDSLEMGPVEGQRDPEGIYPAPFLQTKINDVESGTASSGIGKSQSDLVDSDACSSSVGSLDNSSVS